MEDLGVVYAFWYVLLERRAESLLTRKKTVSSIPTQYFNKKRGLANGIVFMGGGLGGTVMSLGISRLISSLGVAWSFRIVGLMTLATGLPAAYLMKERAPVRNTTFIEWYSPSSSFK